MPKSSIEKLPEEIRQAGFALLSQGKSINEITAHLNKLGSEIGTEISRSAVGRWTKSARKLTEDLRRSRDMAIGIANQLGEQSANDATTRLISEQLQDIMMCILSDADGNMPTKDIERIAKAQHNINLALRGSQQLITEIEARLKKKQADALTKAEKSGDMQADATIMAMQILGI